MAGHAPEPTARAVERQIRRGTTVMLPTEDAAWVGRELVRRFGLDAWQFALTATDANRWVLRMARQLTGRPKVLVFNYCYHGTVDESVIVLDERPCRARGRATSGPAVDPADDHQGGRVQRRRGAASGRWRPATSPAVLAEPALTNIGIVLPEPGFHDALREITRAHRHAADHRRDAHAWRPGPAATRPRTGLEPDMLTIGKSIAGGVPIGAYGMRRELADQDPGRRTSTSRTSAASAARWPATRCRWRPPGRRSSEVLTDEAFARMIPLAERFTAGVQEVLRQPPDALEHRPARRPRRVPVHAAAAAQRRRGGGRPRRRARRLHAPLPDEPRRPDHAVPQHGADVPGHHRGATSTATARCSPRPSTTCWGPMADLVRMQGRVALVTGAGSAGGDRLGRRPDARPPRRARSRSHPPPSASTSGPPSWRQRGSTRPGSSPT